MDHDHDRQEGAIEEEPAEAATPEPAQQAANREPADDRARRDAGEQHTGTDVAAEVADLEQSRTERDRRREQEREARRGHAALARGAAGGDRDARARHAGHERQHLRETHEHAGTPSGYQPVV